MMSSWLAGQASVGRAIGHTVGLLLAALVSYLVWRGYQTPEFLLDLANWRLC
jgi:hypothetical protein